MEMATLESLNDELLVLVFNSVPLETRCGGCRCSNGGPVGGSLAGGTGAWAGGAPVHVMVGWQMGGESD